MLLSFLSSHVQSRTWVVDKADKEALIGQYKSALRYVSLAKYFAWGSNPSGTWHFFRSVSLDIPSFKMFLNYSF